MVDQDDLYGYGALNSGIKGFAQGMADAEDRKFKRMEMEAKLESQKAERERNGFLDQLTMREKGYTKDLEGKVVADPAAQRQQALEKFAGSHRIPEFDAEGRVIGTKLDPEYVNMWKDKATFDPYGAKSRPTEGEFSAAGFADQMALSEDGYGQLLAKGFDPASNRVSDQEALLGGKGYFGTLTEGLKDPDVKSYLNHKLNFIRAVLRKESGAAISDQEYADENKRYFPQRGDPPEVQAQKAAARQVALNNLGRQGARAQNKRPGMLSGGKLSPGKLEPGKAPAAPNPEDAKLKRLQELRAKKATGA